MTRDPIILDSVETHDAEGEIVVHAAASISKRGAWSTYAITLCGEEFAPHDGWAAGRTDWYGLTCEKCCERARNRERALGLRS